MVRAAIYARKSTKQDVEDEAKSVKRQIDGARDFITKRGWSLDDAHIYTDDGVSGAEFADRAEFQHMMRDAAEQEFDALVYYDQDRFGRHGQKTMAALHKLADLGIEIWNYSTGLSVDLDSFEGRVSTMLNAEAAQQFRDQIRKYTIAAMRRKAEQGLVTGGTVFGYDNVRIRKGHTELRINKAEAVVVQEIYRRAADGQGARTIAAELNARKVPKPRAQQGRAAGWSVSTIRSVLTRWLYRGEIVYGRTAKAYDRELRKVRRHAKREKGQIPKPEATWIKVDAPHLRIVDVETAERVDARLTDRRQRYLDAVARNSTFQAHKTHGKYLLSGGMLICPNCGGFFEGRKNPWKPSPKMAKLIGNNVGHAAGVYICSTRRRKPGVCGNTLALPIDETDDIILDQVQGEVLGTKYVEELLAMVDSTPDMTGWLTSERERLQVEIDRLVDSIAAGVPADTIAPKIRENKEAIDRLDAKLRLPRVARLTTERLRAALEQRVKEWRKELRQEPAVARAVLRQLVGPITLWDDAERPDFVRFETTPTTGLLDGLTAHPSGASPTGFEPVFWP